MSSMAVHPDDKMKLYFATSSQVFLFNLHANEQTDLQIPNLTDVHEISMVGDELWISIPNTTRSWLTTSENRVSRRIDLSDFASSTPEEGRGGEGVEVVDKFHCNLIFQGYDGHLYILVHHTSGRQLIKRIAQKFIKSQGNGGVVNIDTKKRYPLNFKAPHSVRRINESTGSLTADILNWSSISSGSSRRASIPKVLVAVVNTNPKRVCTMQEFLLPANATWGSFPVVIRYPIWCRW